MAQPRKPPDPTCALLASPRRTRPAPSAHSNHLPGHLAQANHLESLPHVRSADLVSQLANSPNSNARPTVCASSIAQSAPSWFWQDSIYDWPHLRFKIIPRAPTIQNKSSEYTIRVTISINKSSAAAIFFYDLLPTRVIPSGSRPDDSRTKRSTRKIDHHHPGGLPGAGFRPRWCMHFPTGIWIHYLGAFGAQGAVYNFPWGNAYTTWARNLLRGGFPGGVLYPSSVMLNSRIFL